MLRTNYQDDVPVTAGPRKYTMTDNGDDTVSFTDVTQYQQAGDSFGAADINATNTAVNRCAFGVDAVLAANETSITIQDAIFFEDGCVEVFVPGSKAQDLVVASIVLSDGEVTITFSSSVDTDSNIRVFCK